MKSKRIIWLGESVEVFELRTNKPFRLGTMAVGRHLWVRGDDGKLRCSGYGSLRGGRFIEAQKLDRRDLDALEALGVFKDANAVTQAKQAQKHSEDFKDFADWLREAAPLMRACGIKLPRTTKRQAREAAGRFADLRAKERAAGETRNPLPYL